jgi:very-short-patch-repair endonuclease
VYPQRHQTPVITRSPVGYPQGGSGEPGWSSRVVGVLEEIRARQSDVVSRGQAIAGGMSAGAVRCRLASGAWQRLFPGVYATFSGPVPRSAWLWAAVLAGGRGAALSHSTAAELAGLADDPAQLIEVTVPVDRGPAPVPGIRWHRSTRIGRACHPTRLPPQTTIEQTVVDLTQDAADVERAVNWVIRACARRLTTVDRMRAAYDDRRKLRWRAELTSTLDDVGSGCHSMLELRYLRDVERAHGLPTGRRQAARQRSGGRWYDDVLYPAYATIVELDGREAHPDEARGRDRRRDNAAVAAGLSALRYGSTDVLIRPCTTAAELAAVLRHNGWPDHPHPCRPTCEAGFL